MRACRCENRETSAQRAEGISVKKREMAVHERGHGGKGRGAFYAQRSVLYGAITWDDMLRMPLSCIYIYIVYINQRVI